VTHDDSDMSEANDVTVLVVDDHQPFRIAAAAVLRRAYGFTLVGEATDGSEAITKVAALQPDLVLMDVRMPGVDGLATTRFIADTWPATRVLLCSTYKLADLPEQARRSGAFAYVGKEELTAAFLRELWDRRDDPPPPPGPTPPTTPDSPS
jgi:NarL family two-component system response regulator YdfI